MNAKILLRWVLLAIVIGSTGIYLLQKSGSSAEQPEATKASSAADEVRADVVVTYFTTDVRCDSCRKIEALSRRAIEEGFPAELASGSVVFRVLNTDRPENQHYVDDYEIANKTVIVSHQVDGREAEWVDRQDVWLLLDDPDAFMDYVREPVKRFLHKG